jgi:hypothetical protein
MKAVGANVLATSSIMSLGGEGLVLGALHQRLRRSHISDFVARAMWWGLVVGVLYQRLRRSCISDFVARVAHAIGSCGLDDGALREDPVGP